MKILINHVYYSPVGHALEALKLSKGFYDANKSAEISVALASDTVYELAKACSWIKRVYVIDKFDVLKNGKNSKSFKQLHKKWDYVLHDLRVVEETKDMDPVYREEQGMLDYYSLCQANLKVKWQGEEWDRKAIPKTLKYKKNSKIEFKLPKKSINFVRHNYPEKGNKVCLMLAGSAGFAYYPSIKTWEKIISALNEKIPNLTIYITGVSKSEKGRTKTQAYSKKELGELFKKFDNVINCYNIGLWNQLALIQKSGVFISPHTGFAFLAPCVNTPWLAISGGDWPEYFFNDVPFYSVLPEDKDYPYCGQGRWTKHQEIGHKKIIPTMSPKKLDKKIPEIVKYAKILLDKKLSYKQAVKLHVKNILKKGYDLNKFGPFDDALGLDKLKKKLKCK
jgi:ADP-heptose:LPS heptosyltransferase